jgi:hypothetical protein
MPNHIHLLVRLLKDKGITDFMRKFGAGFVGYLNRKYNRKGPLFSKYHAGYIASTEQLKIAFVYIHTNPVSLIESGWKDKGLYNFNKATDFLNNYRWSSYLDYLGRHNFPSVINQDFILSVFNSRSALGEFVNDWLRSKQKMTENRSPIKL